MKMLDNLQAFIQANNTDQIFYEYLIVKMLDKSIDTIKGAIDLNNNNVKKIIKGVTKQDLLGGDIYSIETDYNTVINNIITNNIDSYAWAKEVKFRDLSTAENTNNIYIDIDFYLTPKRVHGDIEEARIASKKALNLENYNYVILGVPGAGKTTLMKKLFLEEIVKKNDDREFICPIVLKLKDIEDNSKDIADYNNVISHYISEMLGLKIEEKFSQFIKKTVDKRISRDLTNEKFKAYDKLIKDIVVLFFNQYKFLVLLDGFDELRSNLMKTKVLNEIESLSYLVKESKFVLTSRTGEFNYNVGNTHVFEICPLTKEQTKKFVFKWLNNTKKAKDLFFKLENSPYFDFTLRPLNLAHLCALYKRNGDIPDKPKSIYRKILHLLLDTWNEQNSGRRESKFSKFPSERKLEFLTTLAYELTTNLKSTVFDKKTLNQYYVKICYEFDLPEYESQAVIDEIESHNGLFIQAGYDKYEFSHKSIQEFLTADYILNLGEIPNVPALLSIIPNELAIAISISKTPSNYFFTLYSTLKDEFFDEKFILPFINRLKSEKPDYNKSILIAISIANTWHKASEFTNNNVYFEIEQMWTEALNFNNIYYSFVDLAKYYNSVYDIKDINGQKCYIMVVNDRMVNLQNRNGKVFWIFTVLGRKYRLPDKIILNETLYRSFFDFAK